MGLVVTLPFTLTNGTTADASQVMANYNALVTAFTLAAAAGVNADITALTALSTPLPIASGGSSVYIGGTSTGSANAQIVASPSPISFSLTAGKRIVFVAGFTNTGATTLNINAQGATAVFRMSPSGPQALTGGEIIAGNIVEAIFDGTQFELISVHNQFGGFGLLTTLASATTTDLGTIPSHNVSISGTTTITGFGSTASTTFPVYQVKFTGALTLTHNGTSLILPGVTNITTAANDTLTALYLGSGNWQVVDYQRASGLAVVAPAAVAVSTTQVLTSGTGATYTTPAGARQLRIRMVGAGGGGGAGITNNGATGGTTTFNSITAIGGGGGANGSVLTGGDGGTGGSGSTSLRLGGSDGDSGDGSANQSGGIGGTSPFGGAGRGGIVSNAGRNAKANSGSGGGGSGVAGANSAGAGGAGEYVELIINTPSATYTYTIGAGGAGGAAGGAAGGDGGSGVIVVDEYY